MGFSTSAAVVIFAASLVYIAAIVYPLFDFSYQRVVDAWKNSNDIQYDKLNTRIVITDMQPSGSDLNVTVFNNGSKTLNSSKLNVLHDGVIKSSFTVSEQGLWSPKNSINVTVNGVSSGRVKIVTSNGVSDYSVI